MRIIKNGSIDSRARSMFGLLFPFRLRQNCHRGLDSLKPLSHLRAEGRDARRDSSRRSRQQKLFKTSNGSPANGWVVGMHGRLWQQDCKGELRRTFRALFTSVSHPEQVWVRLQQREQRALLEFGL